MNRRSILLILTMIFICGSLIAQDISITNFSQQAQYLYKDELRSIHGQAAQFKGELDALCKNLEASGDARSAEELRKNYAVSLDAMQKGKKIRSDFENDVQELSSDKLVPSDQDRMIIERKYVSQTGMLLSGIKKDLKAIRRIAESQAK